MRSTKLKSAEVTRRLKLASELRDLCVALRKAKKDSDARLAEEPTRMPEMEMVSKHSIQ